MQSSRTPITVPTVERDTSPRLTRATPRCAGARQAPPRADRSAAAKPTVSPGWPSTAPAPLVVPLPGEFTALLVGWAPFIVLPPIIAGLVFVIPLAGARARLAAQKERLLDDVGGRIRRTLYENAADLIRSRFLA